MAALRAKLPPPLAPSDTVVVVAPSSPFPVDKLERGLAWLSTEQTVRLDPVLRAPDPGQGEHPYLAGADARRRAELQSALDDPEVRAIVAARGGYGATRIVAGLDWNGFSRSPKWLVGFSDVTALHLAIAARGVASMHGSMLAALGDADDEARRRWLAALRGEPRADWTSLAPLAPHDDLGPLVGPIFGGNLAMLYDAAARGALTVPDGALLLLEDCTERPYRLDRMLTALIEGGHLARVAAVIVGDLTDCAPGKDGRTAEAVVAERLARLGVPVSFGAPFGHGARNESWIVGAEAALVDGGRTLRFST
jgi:muramoyltetrapeptide carboxypeptidase